jgi:RHS repeat-associated protein
MRHSKRQLTRKDSLRAALYRPHVENLEERWMPGDTILSAVLGQAALGAALGIVDNNRMGEGNTIAPGAASLAARWATDANDLALCRTDWQAVLPSAPAASAAIQRQRTPQAAPAQPTPPASREMSDMTSVTFDLFAGLGVGDDFTAPPQQPLAHRDANASAASPFPVAALASDAVPNTAPGQNLVFTVPAPMPSPSASPTNHALDDAIAALDLGQGGVNGARPAALNRPLPAAGPVAAPQGRGGSGGSGQSGPGPGGGGFSGIVPLDPPSASTCAPPETPPVKCCDQKGDESQSASGSDGGYDSSREFGDGGVRYFDGEVRQQSDLLSSDGFGTNMGVTLDYNSWMFQCINMPTPTPDLGMGMTDMQQSYLLNLSPISMTNPSSPVVVVTSSTSPHYFTYDPLRSRYVPDDFRKDTLVISGTLLVFTDTTGEQFTYYNFVNHAPNTSTPAGQLYTYLDKAGNLTTYLYDNGGNLYDVRRSGPSGMNTVQEDYVFTTTNGMVSQIVLQRSVNGGTATPIRQVLFTYYQAMQTGGMPGNLKMAQVQEPNAVGMMTTFDTYYYRYYTGGTAYNADGTLKYVFKPQSYDRLIKNTNPPNGDPTQLSDTQVQPFADAYYNGTATSFNVTVQGSGCSSCTGGQGTFSYQFTTNSSMSYTDGYNNWKYQTVETLPDNSTRTVFANYRGETMLSVFQSGGQSWETFYKYDNSNGSTLWVAHPSALTGYTTSSLDLLNADANGHYQYMLDNQGFVEVNEFYSDDTGSGETTPGDALGYLADTKLQMGQASINGMPIQVTQESYQYYLHQATAGGNSFTIRPLATDTRYQNSDGTGAELTKNTYTWVQSGGSPTAQVATLTVQKPLIVAGQNGPDGTNYDVTTTTYDAYGRVIQTVDPDNKVVNYTYDQATGAVTQMVQDAGGVSQVSLAGAFTPGRIGIATDGMPFSGVGLDGNGDAYSATFAPNGAVTWNTRSFTLGPANQADVVVAAGQTIALPAASAASLSLLATAVGGGMGQQNQTFTVTYSDGSMQTYTRSLSDWLAPQNYAGEAAVLTMPYYDTASGGRMNQTSNLYGYSFALNPLKQVQSLTLPNNNHVVLLAASLTNLDLTTSYTVDAFGRDTSIQEPNGTAQFTDFPVSLSYVVYNDFTHETRTYPGWNSTTHTPTGPTRLTREDRSTATIYYETLTMSAAPHLTNNVPDGTEAISQVQSLRRDLTNNSGQKVERDAYVDVGPGYSYSAQIAGAHYNATISAFDMRGRLNKTVTANGTISRTVYDALSRVVSTWIGTNDTGATDSDPTGNHTPGNNMIQVTGNVYDNGGTGDSTLTQTTQYPHGSSDSAIPPRVTNMYYDWRDRLVYTKAGAQASEDTTTHRPITYQIYDNLDEVTTTQRYDGDGVYLVVYGSNGVPVAPSNSLLRAQTNTLYDAQGRVYQTDVYSVSTSGVVSLYPLVTNNWYNHRGLLVKTSAPGGLVQKMAYDNAGRETFVYTTDGNGDAAAGTAQGWSDARQVNSMNNVLTQTQTQYDGDSNPVFVTTWDRYHNSTYTGDLSQAPTQQARISFDGKFYDAADRLTTEVNYGNNGNGFLSSRPTLIALRGSLPDQETDCAYLADTVQTVTLSSGTSGGNFTLSFNGSPASGPINFNATAAQVQTAIANLTGVGVGNVLVTGPAGTTGMPSLPGGPWNVRFTGTLAGQNEPLLTANGSGLMGGTVTVALASQAGDAGRVQTVTDPRGLATKTDYDLLGRSLRTVAAFTNNPAFTNNWNQVTEYAYDGDNHVQLLTAYPGDGSIQQTQYTYTANPADSSWISSNDLLTEVQYPDKMSGRPSTQPGDQEIYQYDNLGETRTRTQRTGTMHNYSYDVLSRPTLDSVSTFGPGVDQTVGVLGTAYDTYGNAATFTSYAPNGTTILNQVQRTYNGFGQLTAEAQYHGDPSLMTTPHGTVNYAYSGPTATANYSRLSSIMYPSSRQIDYGYGTASDTLDNAISRFTSITDHSTGVVLETYVDGSNAYSDYLGLNTAVQRSHPQTGINLTYIGGNSDANDPYGGLDRFGRVVDQNWQGSGGSTDHFQYGYDYDGNRLYRANLVTQGLQLAFDELYHTSGTVDTYSMTGQLQSAGYDVLNQMTAFSRGTLSADHSSISNVSHGQAWTLDALGNWKQFTSDMSIQSRQNNQQNELTQINTANLGYDNNGNTTQDDYGNQLKYDAWNRLVSDTTSGMTVLASYSYDALGRRVQEVETNSFGDAVTRDLYFSAQWQVLEEHETSTGHYTNLVRAQNVWSPVYVDALVERDRDPARNGSGSLSERFYLQQDANWNVTALVDTTGTVQERFIYDPYGKPTDASGQNVGALNVNWTTKTGGDSYGWVYLHQGGRYDAVAGLYNFRRRDYSPTLGRWTELDPLAYGADDTDLYRFVHNSPAVFVDPAGTAMPPGAWGYDPRYHPGFKICQRDILGTDSGARAANCCGGQHTYIQLGPVDKKGQPLPGTKGVGWGGGNPTSEQAFKPNSCAHCSKTQTPLAFGKGAGTPANAASDDAILDCLKNYPPRKKYDWIWYNCADWANEAATACGLKCTTGPRVGICIARFGAAVASPSTCR